MSVLMGVRNNIQFFLTAMKCSIMSAMEYKVAFFTKAIFTIISNIFWLITWFAIFSANDNSLNGIEFDVILYLWTIPLIAFGIADFFFGGVQNINRCIISGEMDSYMLQPKHPLLNILTSKCNFGGFGDLIYGIALGIIVTKGNLISLLILLFLGVFSSIFYLSTNIIIRSISVWLGDTEIIAKNYMNGLLIQFSTYPEQLFTGVIKVLLYTVIPVGYMVYLPIRVFTECKYIYIVYTIIAGIVFMLLAVYIFNNAMKHYESGNGMSMRQ